MQGNWLLRVTDLVAEDVGVLQGWRLALLSTPAGEALHVEAVAPSPSAQPLRQRASEYPIASG